MGWIWGTCQKFEICKPEWEKDHLGALDVDERIILKWNTAVGVGWIHPDN
jgi:hypothetical protein